MQSTWSLTISASFSGVTKISVLSGVRHPAILLEGGFMSHPHEARLIDNDAYQNALANSILDAVVKYRFAVSKKPAPAAPR